MSGIRNKKHRTYRSYWPYIVLAMCLPLLAGCGNKEARSTVEALNKHETIIERDGHVKKVEIERMGDRLAFRFEAEILNEQGEPIGRVTGRRVEGFGTRVRHFEWYDAETGSDSSPPD